MSVGILFFILGAVVGSFLNVVSLRFNTGAPIALGRSECFSCGQKLKWYELVPILSFLILRGKCGTCKTAISWQYLLVELLTAILFSVVVWVYYPFYGLSELLVIGYWLLVFSLLIVIAVYDFRHKIIPNLFSYSFIALSLIALFLPARGEAFAYNLLAGPLLFSFFFLLWFISKGSWMGFGDVKLSLGIGWFLGLVEGVNAVVFSFWIGAIAGLIWIGINRLRGKTGAGLKSQIPFGPFLILGLLIEFFLHIDLFYLSLIVPI